MNDTLRKSWIYLLGALFIVSSFIYLLKYTVDQGWITDGIKIGLGLAFGSGCVIGGLKWLQKKQQLVGEIVAGMGVAILYTTFSFSGIYYAFWEPMTVFLSMIALTLGLSVLAFRIRLRLLMNISLLGGLLSPWMLRPETDQVFTLFLYLLVLNAAFFTISLKHRWTELRLTSFIGTWFLYAVYFFQFDPELGKLWSLPFRYALAAFGFYVIAFLVSSWKNNVNFDGLNLYLGIVNAIVFGLWSIIILDRIVPYSYPLIFMGVLYVALACIVQRLTRSFNGPVITKLVGGLLLILIASTQIGHHMAVKPLINVYFWMAIALALLIAGTIKAYDSLKAVSIAIWFIVVLYWYTMTWSTPWGTWFGTFIPFLNWAALAWELLAAVGFYLSLRISFNRLGPTENKLLAYVYSVISHLIIGGLLTVQIRNMIREYHLGSWMDLQLTLSIAWGIYALLLFLWGAYSRQSVYRIFGSIVLIAVAIKTLLFDLSGSETIYKVLVLFTLGVISFVIAYINGKWKNTREASEEVTQEVTGEPSEESSGEMKI